MFLKHPMSGYFTEHFVNASSIGNLIFHKKFEKILKFYFSFFVYCYLNFSRVWKCFGVGAEMPFLMLRSRE